jgi:hypothetical protein
VLPLVVLCEFQVLSKYTIYRSNCHRNTAVTIQQTKDVRTKKTLQLLPTRKAAKCAISKTGKSHFCWRKTDPCDITSWRGFNSLLVGCDAVSVREWFPTFQKIVLPSSSKASSQSHSKKTASHPNNLKSRSPKFSCHSCFLCIPWPMQQFVQLHRQESKAHHCFHLMHSSRLRGTLLHTSLHLPVLSFGLIAKHYFEILLMFWWPCILV